ncbi:aminoglycoside phosphotransferase family protein [Glycomyces sp. A-F 0318]|uniref:aminoglycoside phosphotransferase family protein n=1 Tax=Glycomyces amatae TaxID=2881355 RepID=UPI001E5AFDB8|nr:aminoglycoside phosphotransferase family protein [Glycomyces amatae]MCD0445938.1 aminoglycoside phosphotransferase family protein [Glycomyces amatae]
MFTEALARSLAQQAARELGIASRTSPQLIRMGEHGMFRLGGGAVARVARGLAWQATAERELAVARYLHECGVPTGQPLAEAPVLVHGHPVTFWRELDVSRRATFPEIGAVLAALHQVPLPESLALPDLDAFERVAERLQDAPIGETDRQTLLAVAAELAAAWAQTDLPARRCLIHGDPHSGNVAFADDQAVLIDLETVCIGPPEWDLALPGTYTASLHWLEPAEYQGFVAAYGGTDVTAAPHFRLLRRIRELRMTSWLAQHAGESAATAAQLRHRVACLADDRVERVWSRR